MARKIIFIEAEAMMIGIRRELEILQRCFAFPSWVYLHFTESEEQMSIGICCRLSWSDYRRIRYSSLLGGNGSRVAGDGQRQTWSHTRAYHWADYCFGP